MTASTLSTSLINATLSQVGWFACVLGAARGWGLEGALIAFGLSAVHLTFADKPLPEIKLLMAAGLIGMTIDSLHAGFGVLSFANHVAGNLAPLWIIALWVQFGTVLHFCMHWLSRRYLLAAILGMIGGPLSFLAGERLGAAAFGEPRALSIAILAVSWALALPTLVFVADRLGGAGRYRWFTRTAADPAAVSS